MGIHNKNVVLYAKDIEFPELNIEIKDSSLYGIFFENVTIKDLKLLSLEISEYKNAKFKSFKTYFDNSNIGSIWLHNSTFFNGFLLRNKSSVRTIRLNDCSIDYSFTYMDSKSAEITVESSILDDLNFENVDINKKGISVSIDKINIFRTEVKTGFRIWDVEFKELHFHRVNILRNEGLSDLKKDIHISVPERCQEVNKIDIRECNIEKRLSITLNNINEINSHDSNFLFLGISFWKILSFNCVKNLFQDGVSWGYQNQLKTIEKFVFENCEVRGRFYLSYTYFDKLLKIHGTSFNSYPSFFNSNTISDSCDVDFEYTNLKNFVFQNINFKNVSFKNIDIDNVEFQNFEWDSIDKCFFSRLKVKDENKSNSEIKNLIDNKNIYSKLISSFQKNNERADTSVIYVPAAFATDAICEAADAGVKLVVCITEGVPVLDMVRVLPYLRERGARLIGPNCPGIISPGKCKVGIMPGPIHARGAVGVVSRSGTLTYEVVHHLTKRGFGQSTCLGIGGDPIVGTNILDALELFAEDEETECVVLIGEIGGSDEEEAAAMIARGYPKKVAAFIAGQTAPPGKRMGHAGAIVSGGSGTAAEKIAAFKAVGVEVAAIPGEIVDLVARLVPSKGASKRRCEARGERAEPREGPPARGERTRRPREAGAGGSRGQNVSHDKARSGEIREAGGDHRSSHQEPVPRRQNEAVRVRRGPRALVLRDARREAFLRRSRRLHHFGRRRGDRAREGRGRRAPPRARRRDRSREGATGHYPVHVRDRFAAERRARVRFAGISGKRACYRIS